MSASTTCDDVTVLRTYSMKARYEADGVYNPADWEAQLSLLVRQCIHAQERPVEELTFMGLTLRDMCKIFLMATVGVFVICPIGEYLRG